MQTIKINVVDKVATAEGNPFIVCGNDDYTILFNFDKAWDGYNAKTARFSYEQDGETINAEVPFSGNSCLVPAVYNIKKLEVGVYAGDILSTTRCKINCKASILDGEGIGHEAPPEDVYNQIVDICNDAVTAANEATATATEFEATSRESFANAIKGNLYGAAVRTDDVSPVKHRISCRLTSDTITDFSSVTVSRYGKNLYDATNELSVSKVHNGYFVMDENSKWYELIPIDTLPEILTISTKIVCDDYGREDGSDTSLRLYYFDSEKTQLSLKVGSVATANKPKSSITFNKSEKPEGTKYIGIRIRINSAGYTTESQIELNPTETEYEPFKSPQTVTANADGTVEGITSLSPTMTLLTDTAGTVINCEYNKDTNKTLSAMTTAEGTVVSPNADFAEVAEWADGNPDNEDRTGYFVCANVPVDGIVMKKATSVDDVKGVSIQAPAFAGNYSKDKLDSNGKLLPKYSYVAIIGFVPVIDNGTCTVGGRCMPDDNGCAIPSSNSMGYQVVNRIDEDRVLIIIEPNGDMVQRIKTRINELQNEIDDLEEQVNNGGTGGGGSIAVDQDYLPESSNAQSGIAVSQAINESVGDINTALDEIIALQEALIGGDIV